MNKVSIDTREHLLSLCHLIKERDPVVIYKRVCEMSAQLVAAKTCLLFLLDQSRKNLILQSGSRLGDVHFSVSPASVELQSERAQNSCPFSSAIFFGQAVQFQKGISRFNETSLNEILPDRHGYTLLMPIYRTNGETIGLFMFESHHEIKTQNELPLSILLQAIVARVEDVFDKKIALDRKSQLARVTSQIDRDRTNLRFQLNSRPSRFVGKSIPVKQLRENIAKASRNKEALLIVGEAGTMRGLAAQEVHDLSDRSNGRFVSTDASFLMNDAAQFILCGNKRGAIKGMSASTKGLIREASGGTLYIENIEELPDLSQKLLLSYLETKHVQPIGSERAVEADTRLIFSASPDFLDQKSDARLNSALLYYLSAQSLKVPSLQERQEDFETIVDRVLVELAAEGSKKLHLDASAIMWLKSRKYDGNLRELRALIKKIETQATAGEIVHKKQLIDWIEGEVSDDASIQMSLKDTVNEFERNIIVSMLNKYNGNRQRVADELSVPKRTLAEKCKRYQL